jgi:hypothetical protein
MYEDHWRWQDTNPLVMQEMGVARGELLRRGASISETHDLGGFAFAYFSDPDGN